MMKHVWVCFVGASDRLVAFTSPQLAQQCFDFSAHKLKGTTTLRKESEERYIIVTRKDEIITLDRVDLYEGVDHL